MTAGQLPAGSSVVIVNTTEPAFTSAAEGVYVAFTLAVSLNVPVPLLVQSMVEALPPAIPASERMPCSQIVSLRPADTVAAWLIVIVVVATAGAQPPAEAIVLVTV